MFVSVLGSGSSGNCTFVEADKFRFLVDAGFSAKKIEQRLNQIDIAPNTIKAILVTHEHSDHINGVGILSRKYDIPFYITKESYEKAKDKIGKVADNNLNFIDDDFILGDNINFSPFDVMHDAVRTIGFSIKTKGEKKLAIATDIGYTTNIVKEKFKDSDVVIIESNYDFNMLMNGPYPWNLKNRIKGKNGHLSNVDTSKFIESIYSEKLKKVFLAHLSKDNNDYEKAFNTVRNHLVSKNIDLDVEIASQDNVTELFFIK